MCFIMVVNIPLILEVEIWNEADIFARKLFLPGSTGGKSIF